MNIKKRVNEDKGAANSVSFMLILVFIMGILLSFADVGIYFNIRNQMQAAAEGGARVVAIYGGSNPNSVSNKYGDGITPQQKVRDMANASMNLGPGKLAEITTITCGPGKAASAGSPVNCVINYRYNGVLKTNGLFGLGGLKSAKGVSVSEVKPN